MAPQHIMLQILHIVGRGVRGHLQYGATATYLAPVSVEVTELPLVHREPPIYTPTCDPYVHRLILCPYAVLYDPYVRQL